MILTTTMTGEPVQTITDEAVTILQNNNLTTSSSDLKKAKKLGLIKPNFTASTTDTTTGDIAPVTKINWECNNGIRI